MTIFDWVNNVLVHKKHWDSFTEDEQKKFSPFIINRWLSMDKDFIEIVNVFQKYSILQSQKMIQRVPTIFSRRG